MADQQQTQQQEKVRLRASMKARRDAMSEAVRRAGAIRLAEIALPPLPAARVAISGFLAMGSEIDTGPLLARLAALGHSIALPVMVGKSAPLEFRVWSPGDPIVERMWGIREPVPTAECVVPHVLLVPLLAFDRQGRRLGYGGGYYDRTLAALRAAGQPVAIGLGFAEQEVDAVPHLDYDEPLDWVLTPSGAIRTGD